MNKLKKTKIRYIAIIVLCSMLWVTASVHALVRNPTDLTSYTGDVTITGDLTVTGQTQTDTFIVDTSVAGDLDMGGYQITNAGIITGTNFVATSTTATSTFAGGLTVDTSDFVVDPDANRVGIGTTDPDTKFHVLGTTPIQGLVEGTTNVSWRALSTAADSYAFLQLQNDTRAWTIMNDGALSDIFKIRDSSAGQDRFAINSSGNVGIGTSSPDVKLHVGNNLLSTNFIGSATGVLTANGTFERIWIQGTSDAGLQLVDSGATTNEKTIQLITDGGVTIFRSINDAGSIISNNLLVLDHSSISIGIGTAAPATELEVSGTVAEITIDSATSNDAVLQFFENGSVSSKIGYDTSDGAFKIIGGSNAFSASHLVVTDAGNVGIGTSSPVGILHVSAGTSGDANLIIEADEDNNDENDNPAIVFRHDGGGSDFGKLGLVGDAGQLFTGSLANAAYFGTFAANIPVQIVQESVARLTVDASGNVGIGTTTPAAKLDIYGGLVKRVREVNAATYTVTANDDYFVDVVYTLTGAPTITMPAIGNNFGQEFVICDTGNNASANNITIDTTGSDVIDWAATAVINSDGDCVTMHVATSSLYKLN